MSGALVIVLIVAVLVATSTLRAYWILLEAFDNIDRPHKRPMTWRRFFFRTIQRYDLEEPQ